MVYFNIKLRKTLDWIPTSLLLGKGGNHQKYYDGGRGITGSAVTKAMWNGGCNRELSDSKSWLDPSPFQKQEKPPCFKKFYMPLVHIKS